MINAEEIKLKDIIEKFESNIDDVLDSSNEMLINRSIDSPVWKLDGVFNQRDEYIFNMDKAILNNFDITKPKGKIPAADLLSSNEMKKLYGSIGWNLGGMSVEDEDVKVLIDFAEAMYDETDIINRKLLDLYKFVDYFNNAKYSTVKKTLNKEGVEVKINPNSAVAGGLLLRDAYNGIFDYRVISNSYTHRTKAPIAQEINTALIKGGVVFGAAKGIEEYSEGGVEGAIAGAIMGSLTYGGYMADIADTYAEPIGAIVAYFAEHDFEKKIAVTAIANVYEKFLNEDEKIKAVINLIEECDKNSDENNYIETIDMLGKYYPAFYEKNKKDYGTHRMNQDDYYQFGLKSWNFAFKRMNDVYEKYSKDFKYFNDDIIGIKKCERKDEGYNVELDAQRLCVKDFENAYKNLEKEEGSFRFQKLKDNLALRLYVFGRENKNDSEQVKAYKERYDFLSSSLIDPLGEIDALNEALAVLPNKRINTDVSSYRLVGLIPKAKSYLEDEVINRYMSKKMYLSDLNIYDYNASNREIPESVKYIWFEKGLNNGNPNTEYPWDHPFCFGNYKRYDHTFTKSSPKYLNIGAINPHPELLGIKELCGENMDLHADGGIFDNAHIGIVAEEGAEVVIPLSSTKRRRGLELLDAASNVMWNDDDKARREERMEERRKDMIPQFIQGKKERMADDVFFEKRVVKVMEKIMDRANSGRMM